MHRLNIFFAGFFAIALFSVSASGAVLTVSKTNDTDDGVCDADCSLREAVLRADSDSAFDVIVFSPSLIGATVEVDNPIQFFNIGTFVIQGPGADLLTISGNDRSTIFAMSGHMQFKIADVTLAHAKGAFPGTFSGAAIRSFNADIEIDRVTFLKNDTELGASGEAGAVYLAGGSNRISNSTFADNKSRTCGALEVFGSSSNPNTKTTIVNTTFYNNVTTQNGGALCFTNFANIKLRNVTIVGNTGANGGGVVVSLSSKCDIGNSVIAGNTGLINFPELVVGSSTTTTSAGNNHIGEAKGDSNTQTVIAWQPSDMLDTPPMLGPLAMNGGRTQTALPLAGSPLIDSGSNALSTDAALVIDQRGFSRVIGTAVDKGASESSSVPAELIVMGRVVDVRGRALPRARVVLTDMMGNTRKIFANSRGYYTFPQAMNDSYFVTAFLNPNTFPSIWINVNNDLIGIDLAAQ